MAQDKIEAIVMIEILGKPPEHLVSTLEEIISKIEKEIGLNVKEKKIHEPKELKENKELYTTFAEIVIEAEKISQIVALAFKYAPAHIEITNPEEILMSNHEWNDTLNGILMIIHKYDEVARILQNENKILAKRLEELSKKNKKD